MAASAGLELQSGAVNSGNHGSVRHNVTHGSPVAAQISDVSGISAMPSLVCVRLAFNLISDASAFVG